MSTSRILIFPTSQFTLEDIAKHLHLFSNDIWSITDETSIKIDTNRQLQMQLTTTAIGENERQIVIWPAEKITEQAQQALLKILEEPPVNTQITLVTSSPAQLLATIQSRCTSQNVHSRFLNKETEEQNSLQNSIFSELQMCKKWSEVVTIAQKASGKKAETKDTLQRELTQKFPVSTAAIHYQETLIEVLNSLNHNVQPALCMEKLLYSTYEKMQNS